MNVNKILILLVLVISFFQISFSVNICNVGLSEPWFKVNSVAGENILIVDNDGDVFLRGKDHLNSNSKNEKDSFEIGNLFFNSKTSYFNLNNFYESQSSVGTSGLVIKSASSNKNIASFSNSGIKSKGKGIYQGSQSNCMSDGYIYCNLDDVTRENRDYYCNITGELSGSCKYNVIDSEDCSTKLTIDTDGNNIYTKGHVIDYTDCSVGNCNSNTYYDTCNGNSNVYEFTADNFGTGFIKTLHSCGTDGYVCVGSTSKYKDYSCSSGACSSKYTSSTYCYDGCNTNNGICKVDCVGSWVGGSTCSATCGGGHYTDTYKITTAAQNGGKSCSNNNGDTRTGGTCNTQACCTSHSYYSCVSNGYVYWFNSCGVQEDVYDSCDMQCLNTGHNSYRCVECLTTSDCGTNHICDDGNCRAETCSWGAGVESSRGNIYDGECSGVSTYGDLSGSCSIGDINNYYAVTGSVGEADTCQTIYYTQTCKCS